MSSGRLVATAVNSGTIVCGFCRSRAAASCSTFGRKAAASVLPIRSLPTRSRSKGSIRSKRTLRLDCRRMCATTAPLPRCCSTSVYGAVVAHTIKHVAEPLESRVPADKAREDGPPFPGARGARSRGGRIGSTRMIDIVDAWRMDVSSLPVVTLSYGQTLDGRLATSTGSSQWISAPESLRFSHELRVKHDAIMVGAGTVCKDDRSLTVRLVAGSDPLRVVVDSTLRTPLTSAVLMEEAAPGTVLAVTDRAPAG